MRTAERTTVRLYHEPPLGTCRTCSLLVSRSYVLLVEVAPAVPGMGVAQRGMKMRLVQPQRRYRPAHCHALWVSAVWWYVLSAGVVAPSVDTEPAASGDDGTGGANELVSGAAETCACESASGWQMMAHTFFTGPGKLYVTTISESAEQCRLACCYRELGCQYFSFDGRAGTPQTCTLWVSIEGNTPSTIPGYTSGKILGQHCKPPAGIDPMHPRKLAFLNTCL